MLRPGAIALLGIAVLIAGGLLAAVAWVRSGGGRAWVLATAEPRLEARLGPVDFGETWELGWRGGVVLGPLTVQGPPDGGPPLLAVERVQVWPDWAQAMRGRAAATHVHLSGVRVNAGPRAKRLEWLRARVSPDGAEKGGGGIDGGTASLPTLSLERVVLSLDAVGDDDGRRTVAPGTRQLGPLDARAAVQPGENGRELLLEAQWDGGTAKARLFRGASRDWRMEASWDALPLDVLTDLVRPGLVVGGRTEGTVSIAGTHVRFDGRVDGAAVRDPRLAEEPIGPWRAAIRGEAEVAGGMLTLQPLTIRLGGGDDVTLEASARLPLKDGKQERESEDHFQIDVALKPASLQALLAALPTQLAPREEIGRIDGPLSGRLEAAGPWARREAWKVDAELELAGLRTQARSGMPSPLMGSFEHRPLVGEAERGRSLRVGPSNPFFVPLGEVPGLLVRAVLLSEDSFFFTHPGFDVPALTRNLLAPKDDDVVRGGSTLTQQLAKNLYLSREKTFARKVREALLTIALEASLPKERLLEIYLNVIEWGPDVYGLGEAAWHYFGKDARALGAREAVFLATIIPNPIRYHGYCSKGALSELWEKRVEELLLKLYNAGDLDPWTLATARIVPLQFRHLPLEAAFEHEGGLQLEPEGSGE